MQNNNGFTANFTGQLHFGIPGKDGGYYLVNAEQINANTLRLTFTPSQDGMPLVDPVDISIPGATDEQIQEIVQEYLAQNPPQVTESDPTVPQWAKASTKPAYTADEVGAVGIDQLEDVLSEALAQAKNSGIFNGEDGYSPVRGTDYWTSADIAEIKSYVDEAILGGAW